VATPPPRTPRWHGHKAPEGVELSAGDGLGEVDELHPKAQAGFVGPEPVESRFQVIVAIAGGRSPLTANVASMTPR